MKSNCVKVIFLLLLLSSVVLPGTTAALPASSEPQLDHSIQVVEIPLTYTLENTEPAAPPTSEVSVEARCNKAVYVDEQNPTTNMNSGAQKAYLRVGIGPEFGGEMWTLLSFHPIKRAQGGPLPDDAEVTRAQIKLYKESGPSGVIRLWGPQEDFNESSVNWNTKPRLYNTLGGNMSAPSANGWCYGDLADFIISDALSGNHAARVVLRPTWTTINKSISFHSNEHPSLAPKLVIYYKVAAAQPGSTPAPAPPAPSPSDTTPCTLSYTVNPTNPRPGQRITITARATDNQAMYYLAIMRGSTELARRDASAGQRELEVSYSETAQLPSMSYQIFADDLSPSASPVSRTVTVPVTGSGTAPTVTVTTTWLDVERVIPEKYRLIKNDGQRVQVTAEASDPDGIRDLHIFINGVDHPFTFGSHPTSVSRTVEWVNNQPAKTRFYYYAQARDREGQTTTAQGGDYQIAQPQDIKMIWSCAPSFHNFGLDGLGLDITWTRMRQIFSDAECWYAESWGWRDVSAENYWEDYVRGSAGGGLCYGFATLAIEIYNGRISPSSLEMLLNTWQLGRNNSYTREWIEARQAGQYGEEVQIPWYNRGTIGAQGTLHRAENDLERDKPGIVCISEGDSGHAVAAWMVRYMPDGTARIYVYDSNYVNGIHNANADINNFNHYPYIFIDGSDWSYQFNSTSVWNDEINYSHYEEACGDMGESVTDPRLGPDAPYLSDHDIPNSTDWYIAWVTPGADVYFEDEEGNITGMYKGHLRKEIPGSRAVIPLMGGAFTDHELYIVPKGKKLSIRAEGTVDGEYNLNLMGENTLYSIKKKKIRKGVEDLLGFEPWKGSLGYRLRIQPGVADDNFMLIVAASFDSLVEALGRESTDREYIMEDVSATEDSDFAVYVEEGGDTFVIDNYGDDIQFDAVTRSTESANTVDPNTDPGYIPSSVQEDITLEQGRRAEITPDSWATGEQKGKLHTLKKRAQGEGGGFPIIPVIIGVVVLAAVGAAVGILFGKGILGKKKKV